MNRREFIRTSSLVAAALSSQQLASGQNLTRTERSRAAIIGHTGRGDYGHGLDLVFNDFDQILVVAVADPEEKGREQARQRSKALRQYAGYREMLQSEMPQLVCVAPRWSDQHLAMAKAAMAMGAHVYTEKPFTQTLAEADELLAISKRLGPKIAVAHQVRLSPVVVQLKEEIARGLIGELVQIRSWGKQDKRAGGEDLVVLGTHIFDMMRLFAGDPISCRAEVWDKGEAIGKPHAREATEKVGLVAGDEIEAQFIFPKQVPATFTSRARLRDTLGPWAVELIGTKGIARILMDVDPRIYILKSEQLDVSGKAEAWQRFDKPLETGFTAANRRVVEDWLKAIDEKREAACSGYNGMKALEMVMAVYESALNRSTAIFPLRNRQHPLAK